MICLKRKYRGTTQNANILSRSIFAFPGGGGGSRLQKVGAVVGRRVPNVLRLCGLGAYLTIGKTFCVSCSLEAVGSLTMIGIDVILVSALR